MGAEAAAGPEDAPRDEYRRVGRERQKPRAPRGARDGARALDGAVQEDRVGREVRGGADGELAGQEAREERDRGEHGGSAAPFPARGVVQDERDAAEKRGDERVAIGEPGERGAVGVVDGVDEEREPGDRGGRLEPPVQERHRAEEKREPREAVGVHQRRVRGPEPLVEQVREGREGAKKGDLEVRIAPPREHEPLFDEALVLGDRARREGELVEHAAREAHGLRLPAGDEREHPVVEGAVRAHARHGQERRAEHGPHGRSARPEPRHEGVEAFRDREGETHGLAERYTTSPLPSRCSAPST